MECEIGTKECIYCHSNISGKNFARHVLHNKKCLQIRRLLEQKKICKCKQYLEEIDTLKKKLASTEAELKQQQAINEEQAKMLSEASIALGHIPKTSFTTITWQDFVKEYYDEDKVNPINFILESYHKWAREKNYLAVDQKTIIYYVLTLRKLFKSSTVRKIGKTICSVFNKMYSDKTYTLRRIAIKDDRARRVQIDMKSLKVLFEDMKTIDLDLLRTMLALMENGCRISSVSRAKYKDFVEGKEYHQFAVVHCKGSKKRPKKSWLKVKDMITMSNSKKSKNFVFYPNLINEAKRDKIIAKRIRDYMILKLGKPPLGMKIGPHCFRDLFINNTFRAALKAAKNAVGHSSVELTQNSYLWPSNQMERGDCALGSKIEEGVVSEILHKCYSEIQRRMNRKLNK